MQWKHISLSVLALALLLAACGESDVVPNAWAGDAVVHTSGDFSSKYPGPQAFDGKRATMWISETYETPAWIAYSFEAPTHLHRYVIVYSNGRIKTRSPKDFEFQGSNGEAWTTLDVQKDQVNWKGSEDRSYILENPGTYRHYRLLVTDDNDDRDDVVVISIGELQLIPY